MKIGLRVMVYVVLGTAILAMLVALTVTSSVPPRLSRQHLLTEAECNWAGQTLNLDERLDTASASRITDPATAGYYSAMARAWHRAADQLAAVCRTSTKLTAAQCGPTIQAITTATEAHLAALEPDNLSDADAAWHRRWLSAYDALAGYFVRVCPAPKR